MSPDAYEAFAAACALERAAWELVKDKLPGTPGFEEGPWLEWRAAVRLSDNARQGLAHLTAARDQSRRLPIADALPAGAPAAAGDEATPFRPGDIVRLRSDGVPMNVRSISDSHAMCTWFDLEGHRKVDVFPLDALELLHDLSGLDDRGDRA